MRSYLIIKSNENYPKQVLRFIEYNVEVILLTYQYINNEPFGCFLTWWYCVISFCGCHQYNKCTPGVSPWPPLSYFVSPAYLYLYFNCQYKNDRRNSGGTLRQKITQRYPEDIPKMSQRYPKDIPKISQ